MTANACFRKKDKGFIEILDVKNENVELTCSDMLAYDISIYSNGTIIYGKENWILL